MGTLTGLSAYMKLDSGKIGDQTSVTIKTTILAVMNIRISTLAFRVNGNQEILLLSCTNGRIQ